MNRDHVINRFAAELTKAAGAAIQAHASSRPGAELKGSGVLVNITSREADYGTLLALSRSTDPLPCPAGDLMAPPRGDGAPAVGLAALPDSAQVCSCNNVTKGQICAAVREQGLDRAWGPRGEP